VTRLVSCLSILQTENDFSPLVTLVLLMLQFLLADYLTGYKLPSLRKTLTTLPSRISWTLTSQPNSYALVYLSVEGEPIATGNLVDKCQCDALAIRLSSSNGCVLSLLEDGSERMVNTPTIPEYDNADLISGYLTDRE